MTEETGPAGAGPVPVSGDLEEFAGHIADQVESFLVAVQAVASEEDGGLAVPLLLLEVAQISLAGARLGAQVDFNPGAEYQPDVGPEPDLDRLRLRLARTLDSVDTYSFVDDPYQPEVVESQLSDDLTSIATDLANGLRHYRAGNVAEALWWWQFSYVSSWGNLAGGALNALWSVVHHDRLDAEFSGEDEQVAAANEMLESGAITGS